MSPKLNLWVDVGGTFTDAILWSEPSSRKETSYRSLKVLSSGKIRCTAILQPHSQKLRLIGLPHDSRNFWTTAQLSISISPYPTFTSRIVASDEDGFEIDSEIPAYLPPSLPLPADLWGGLESPALAAHLLLDIPLAQKLPQINVRLGTTRGTNALLTRTGAAVGLCITRGFGDIPYIGNQDRPELFALDVVKPLPLCENILEVDERIDAAGNILSPLRTDGLREAFATWKRTGIRSVAIVLMHSYLNSVHERQIAEIAREFAFDEVICSSNTSPIRKLLSRCDTALVDAYLSPIINDYLRTVQYQLGISDASSLQLMTSAGSLMGIAEFRGKDSVLSGPAGGVVAVQELLQQIGMSAALAFDMGGTSTDVSRCTREELPIQYDTMKAGVRMVTPILSIHTVAAGGGSICSFDGVQLHVGPASAGSFPGPACYGQGGPLTITDINVLLGIIPENALPFSIDRKAAQARLSELAERIRKSQGVSLSDFEIASGFRQLANQTMADAIRVISTRQGADPREHVLVGFGGAAGQHQCDLAEILEIPEIVDPPMAGLFSARGIGYARHKRFATVPLYQPLSNFSLNQYSQLCTKPIHDLASELNSLGYERKDLEIHVHYEMRYVGTDSTLRIAHSDQIRQLASDFHEAHRLHYGYQQSERDIEICTVRLEAVGPSPSRHTSHEDSTNQTIPTTPQAQYVWFHDKWIECPVMERSQLRPHDIVVGPAIIVNSGHTTWIAPKWQGHVDELFNLRLRPTVHANMASIEIQNDVQGDSQVDPIFRDLMGQRMATIALSMGEILEKTAISVNIKERRDFSCAIFNADGYLIANAPHVPVHLGAMGQTVRELLQEFPDLHPQDCLITNDPNRGGSHLPDITVVTPVFDPVSMQIIFFVACRAHHAEIGGITAGSMPPHAQSLEEEGVWIAPQYLVRRGESQISVILEQLTLAKYPSRSPHENIADLAAQQAANQFGVIELQRLLARVGKERLRSAMNWILDASATRVQQWIASLPEKPLQFTDQLDDGSHLCATLTKYHRNNSNAFNLRVDFLGTSARHPGNFNANCAIVTAALLYVIRLVTGDDLPLNEGALRPIELSIPASLLSPLRPEQARSLSPAQLPAVAAGNVETSQRVVDVLLGALEVAAASQGTMNNFLFGDSNFGYYETICGGTGATASRNGCDAVQSHMTNTRITDPEVLEVRYPVRLREFSIRRGSGGAGEMTGGNGVVREIEFLKAVQVSIISSRRTGRPPYGMKGGKPGAWGANHWIRANGIVEPLSGTCQLNVAAGDRVRIETPGGGGYGNLG